jgi:NADH-quinone oxidoreductase subunit N
MMVGNILAISQTNIKRLLAYSSIAQSGYLLMAFVPYASKTVRTDTVAAMLFYLVAYCLASFGAWAVVIALEKAEGKGLALEDYAGLGRKHPFLAASMTVFMLSFTGMPLTLGFWGKLYLFSTAVEGGYWGLALIGLLASLVSAYYYLRVVVIMVMRSGEAEANNDLLLNITAFALALTLVVLSFFPNVLFRAAAQALLKLL